MTWLLFMDESGHDHKQLPLEVRGGVALHIGKLWDFVRAWQRLELDAFGARLTDFSKEIKGSKLLDKDRWRWANQVQQLSDSDRRKNARGFLTKGLQKQPPSSLEFAAYGQASIEMARGIFEILRSHEAQIFAAAIPKGVRSPRGFQLAEYLRKDHVFLFERFFYFLEAQRSHGLLIMDETDKADDQRFVARAERYFTRTQTGRQRTAWIVPAPLFVSSDMSVGVQAADLCLYCINWGFRLPNWPALDPIRPEIAEGFAPQLHQLQWEGDGYREGRVFRSYGIVLVPDPYEARD
ncbi:MAG: DUF3800 domain-containing protein [Dongiaceae bacterium]